MSHMQFDNLKEGIRNEYANICILADLTTGLRFNFH